MLSPQLGQTDDQGRTSTIVGVRYRSGCYLQERNPVKRKYGTLSDYRDPVPPKRCPLLSARTDAGHHLYNHYGQSTHINFARNLPYVNEMTVHPDVILTRSPDNGLLLHYPRSNEVRLLCENYGTCCPSHVNDNNDPSR
jgi:hypothetical protein